MCWYFNLIIYSGSKGAVNRVAEKFETSFKIRKSHRIENNIVKEGKKMHRSARPDIEPFHSSQETIKFV